MFSIGRDNNNNLELVGQDHVLPYSKFCGRYKHLMYVPLGACKTLCVAYVFTDMSDNDKLSSLVGVLWGACIMSHRAGSPPKRALRHTATQRVKKCPAHCIVSEDAFGVNLDKGKAHFRMNVFKDLVRTYGVKGVRNDRGLA